MFVKFRTSLTAQILAGVVFVLAALCGIVCVIGYNQFTKALEAQYESQAYNTARTAATALEPGFALIEDLEDLEWRSQLRFLRREWQHLVDTQDATFIYLYQKLSPDYTRFRSLTSVMNMSLHYDVFPVGFIVDMPEEYWPACKAVYEEGRPWASVAVYRQEFSSEYQSGDHITVLIPIYDSDGNVRAVLGVERQMKELQAVRSAYVRHVLLTALAMLLAVLLMYGGYLRQSLLAPIHRIAGEALRFARENTRPDVPLGQTIQTQNEIGQLARTIDRMEGDIQDYIKNLTRVTKEQQQIKAELDIAREIQAAMLPRVFPPFPDRREFDIYATMTPAKEVGGDFYDFFLIDDDHLAMVMADVSGKGVAAALFMVIAKTLIKNRAQMGGTAGGKDGTSYSSAGTRTSCPSTSAILSSVNNQLCEGNEADLFVTVWLGILEISTGKVVASNAGHEYPAIKRASGAWELMKEKHSPAVATLEGLKFRESEFGLRPGDSLYLYTDGVAEATDAQEELFGTDRMIDALNRHGTEPVDELLVSMKREVDAFVGDAPQFDDITMLGLKYYGKREGATGDLTLEARTENLDEVLAFVDGRLEERGCLPKTQMQIDVAVEEIFVNIAHYAYTPNAGPATVRVEFQDNAAVITFIDGGVPYDPLARPDPDVTLPAEERQVGGLGIYMVKKSMDSVSYRYEEGRNIFTMRKELK